MSPEICRVQPVWRVFLRKQRREFGLQAATPFLRQIQKIVFNRWQQRPLNRALHDSYCHWIEIARHRSNAKSRRLERYAATPCDLIQNNNAAQCRSDSPAHPSPIRVAGRVLEGPVVLVWVIHPNASPPSTVDDRPGRHGVPMNPKHVQKPFPIRIRRQQRAQHGSPRRHQGTPRPPHVKPIRRRKRRHRGPLAGTLDPDLRDRHPLLDQPTVTHGPRQQRSRGRVSSASGPALVGS